MFAVVVYFRSSLLAFVDSAEAAAVDDSAPSSAGFKILGVSVLVGVYLALACSQLVH